MAIIIHLSTVCMVQKLSDGRNDLTVAAAGSQAYHRTLCNRKILVHESVFTCHNDELFFLVKCDGDEKTSKDLSFRLSLRSHVFGGLTGQANQPSKYHLGSHLHDKSIINMRDCR